MISKPVRLVLAEHGARLKRQGHHYVFELPNGHNIVFAKTLGDHARGEKNVLAQIKRTAALPRGMQRGLSNG